MAEKPVYDESKIQTLDALSHIRLRPGMYIGRLGNGSNPNDGIYVLLKEVVDNGIDEFIMGHGSKIEITVDNDEKFKVRDYGRGIPLGKVVDCVSKINTGAKYNTEVFQFSVGLNGIGTKAVNALSSHFRVRSVRDGKFKEAVFAEGILQSEKDGKTSDPDGTEVEFTPSRQVFPKYRVDQAFLDRRMWNYAYLNRGLTLILNGQKYHSRGGLKDFVEREVGGEKLYELVHFRDERIEFCFTHTSNYGDTYHSYVNGQYTNDGGTHQSAFKEGIAKGVNDYANKKEPFDANDIREGLFGAIAVKVSEPMFESQTKNKLANPEIRADIVQKVKDFVCDFLHKNKPVAERLLEKIAVNEKMRKGIQELKKLAKETSRKTALKIPKLRDCKHHFDDGTSLGAESMLFITEGDSATGPMMGSRNVLTQALFPLKGKPLNSHGMQREFVYKNEELYYVMKAIGIEDSLDNLRYGKVVIATDADDDGMHIRNLMLTYFLTFFEPLVTNGHLYLLETPLFRVRNTKETIYCYDEEEKEKACAKIGKAAEITRFKGLGEISPKEFGQFIGPDMRLIPVTIDTMSEVPHLLEFFMGKNTPRRKDFIMGNLL
ncbi:MAG: topoisomerase 4 subunit [Verrucomicrobiota bacterium]|jgi:DNA gyrase/topoisomerase IV subunit B